MATKSPRGLSQFTRQVLAHREAALGRMLCIDPATGSTSGVGWALFEGGQFVKSGVVQPPRHHSVTRRLRWIQAALADLGLTQPDVCVIERLRGRMVHPHLHWSVGAILTAVDPGAVLECPIPVWKSQAALDPAYVKGDEADARAFGASVLAVVRGVGAGAGVGKVSRRRRAKRFRAVGAGRVRSTKHRAPRVVGPRSRNKR